MSLLPKNSRSRLIGLTGGIASGKSTVSLLLKKMGYPVLCADSVVHALMRKGGKAYRPIVKIFGTEILLPNREINRSLLGEKVFFDSAALKTLETLVHPLVRNEMTRETRRLAKKNSLIFWDVPLLFEAGLDRFCDQTVCVYLPQKIQLARLIKRDNLNRKNALARIRSQMSLSRKKRLADFVLFNDKTPKYLGKQLKSLCQNLARA